MIRYYSRATLWRRFGLDPSSWSKRPRYGVIFAKSTPKSAENYIGNACIFDGFDITIYQDNDTIGLVRERRRYQAEVTSSSPNRT